MKKPGRKISGSAVRALSCAWVLSLSAAAQPTPQILSVSEVTQNAAHLATKQILVKGHFWCGKEGWMIHDDGYKAILIVRPSGSFSTKHPYHAMFPTNTTRKSDIATLSGQLHLDNPQKPVLIADDITFMESPHPIH